jgi:putative membrane protein insertion efficiency factor
MMTRILMGVIKAYRLLLSPSLGSSCRFEPTCSVYALQALERFGAAKGGYMALTRIGRCHPWCDGGLDPVPDVSSAGRSGLFSRLISSSTQKKSS